MKTLHENEVARTENGTPESLNMYALDVCGPGAVVRAVRDLRAGRPAAFAVCVRDPDGSGAAPLVVEVVRVVPMPGRACLRLAGEGGRPDGPGSSTVHGCGSIYDQGSAASLDPVTVAAYMSALLARRGDWFFLLKST